jgi:hypothetical protein
VKYLSPSVAIQPITATINTNDNNVTRSGTSAKINASSSSSTRQKNETVGNMNTINNQQTRPKSSQPSINTPSITFSPDNCVGAHIKLLNILNETVEGDIYAYDPQLQILVLYESGGLHESSTRKTFRIVKTNTIQQIITLDPSQKKSYVPFSDLSLPLPPVNYEKLREREQKACYEREQHLGSNVTSEAQQIFDQLSKTLLCRWDDDVIVVMDVIRISSPYDLDSVVGGDPSSRARVKKVLKGELDKMQRKV